MTEPDQRRRTFARGRTIAVFVIVVSLFVMGLGWQQNQFQAKQKQSQDDFQDRISDIAQCYQDWGKGVTKALDARSTASGAQTTAERKRADSIDNILLLFVNFRSADPPLTQAQREQQFNERLNKFARAKANLNKEDENVKQTKKDFAYPVLDC